MADRNGSTRPITRRGGAASSLAANIILALAMLAAVIIGTSGFDAGSMAKGFLDTGTTAEIARD